MILNFILDLMFVPNRKTIKANMWFFGIISVLSVFCLGACYALYGEINLISKCFRVIAIIAAFFCTCAFSAYEKLMNSK